MVMGVSHPAKFSDPIMEAITRTLKAVLPPGTLAGEPLVLDPFAGTGRIHRLQAEGYLTVGVELEPEWAEMHPATICGDSTRLFQLVREHVTGVVDAVVTSPCYGNRMADTYAGDAKGSRRFTYRTHLGRDLSPGSAAGLQWGDAYRELHRRVWAQCAMLVRPGGWMLLSMSDHVRNDWTQPVTLWHATTLTELGFRLKRWEPIETQRVGMGSTGSREQRAREEWLLTFQMPERGNDE